MRRTWLLLLAFLQTSTNISAQDSLNVSQVSSLYNYWNAATGMCIEGEYLYLSAGYSGLGIVDISDPANPDTVSLTPLPDYAKSVAVGGNYAYVAASDSGIYCVDITDPFNPEIISGTGWMGRVLELEMAGNYLFARIYNDGISIVDVSNPMEMTAVYNCSVFGSIEDISLDSNYLYFINFDSLYILDVNDPANPGELIGYDPYFSNPISVYAADEYLFMGNYFEDLKIANISNPILPSQTGIIELTEDARTITYSNNVIYTAGSSGISIINNEDPFNPAIAGFLEFPEYPYDSGSGLYCEDSLLYSLNTIYGLQVIDISDIANPQLYGQLNNCGTFKDIELKDNYLYMANWTQGMKILDISNPAFPEEISTYDIPIADNITVCGNKMIVSDYNNGYFIYDITYPGQPEVLGIIYMGWEFIDISMMKDDYLFAQVANPLRIDIIDISDISNPVVVGELAYCHDMQISMNFLYTVRGNIPSNDISFCIYDITSPDDPVQLGSFTSELEANKIYVDNEYAYLSCSESFYIVNVNDPETPEILSITNTNSYIRDIYESDNVLFIADDFDLNEGSVKLYDVSNPADPCLIGYYNSTYFHSCVAARDGIIYLGNGQILRVLDYSEALDVDDFEAMQNPQSFELVTMFPNPFNAQTTVIFTLSNYSVTTLNIYNTQGRLVERLIDSRLSAGTHSVTWDAEGFSSGIYFMRLTINGGQSHAKKLVLMK